MIVGLLAGTFDPPHKGHLQMAKVALWSKKVDKVAFLPCWKHAFGKEPTDFEHRANMTEIMTNAYADDRIETWWHESFIQSSNSIEILEYLHKEEKDVSEFRLILGADNYWKMNKWEQPSKVKSLAKPIWIDRPGQSRIPEESLVCNLNISSSDIRKRIRFSTLPNEKMYEAFKDEMSDQVMTYIIEYGLYKER
jgi:nicotinate (nicotinamide) nucleotide adenylyltransferase